MPGTHDPDFAKGDGYFQVRFLMVMSHETLLKGLESVMMQAKTDHSCDMPNWLGYVGAWAACISHHDAVEEKILFPLLNSHGIVTENESEQHKRLHHDLDVLRASLSSWRAEPAKYDGEVLLSHLEMLSPSLREHFSAEVDGLSRERLEPHLTSEELRDCVKRITKEARDSGDPFIVPPFMMSHSAPQHKYWSNLGWLMYRVVIPALAWRHSGYWKYAPEPLNV